MLLRYMAEGKEIANKEQFFMQMNGVPRDLLTKTSHAEAINSDENEIELSLGLSLNGKFGVDPMKREAKQRLVRSSSIASFMESGHDEARSHALVVPREVRSPILRTSSLPAALAEEEWRKRKEMQSLRRKEVKRKRMEKKSVARDVRGRVDCGSDENDGSVSNGDEQLHADFNTEFPSSLGSQGSGSSGISDLENQPVGGANRTTEMRSPSSTQFYREQDEKKRVEVGGAAEKKANDAKEMLRNAMLNMPCVSTRGDGPNGRKIDGFLYRYRKGEEVSIVCVCHGSFLTPAEFVKHAGGGDVTNPLRHIVINPAPLL